MIQRPLMTRSVGMYTNVSRNILSGGKQYRNRSGKFMSGISKSDDTSMQGKLYNKTAGYLLAIHDFTIPALDLVLERIAKGTHPLNIADLGCATGKNSIYLMQHILSVLSTKSASDRSLMIFYEDLPENNWNEFFGNLREAEQNGLYNVPKLDIKDAVIGKSFYEPLFRRNSMHLILSYVTLHWMSSAPCRIPGNAIHYKDEGVLDDVSRGWQKQSLDDLVKFLRLRANELVDNGEGLFLMFSGQGPNFFNNGLTKPWLFTKAWQAAVEEGSLPIEVIEKCYTLYYERVEIDVEEAVKKVPELELLDLQWKIIPIGDQSDSPEAVCDMWWSIHANTWKSSSGATTEQMEAVRRQTQSLFTEMDDSVLKLSYMYFVVRRKPRRQSMLRKLFSLPFERQ